MIKDLCAKTGRDVLDMIGTGLFTDKGKLAEACGIAGWHVESTDTLEPAMDAWLAAEGPALLDVRVNQMELVMPPKIEATQVAGTALFGVKAVLDATTREVVDLLRNNFLR